MNTYEELAVLVQGDDEAIVSIGGQGDPCVLLGPDDLGHLAGLLGRISEDSLSELRTTARYEPIATLCSEMRILLRTYDETCKKFDGSAPVTRTLAQIQEELDEMARKLF